MDVNAILTLVTNFGVFGSLFIWLFASTRKESRERELALINTLNVFAEKTGDKLDAVVEVVECVVNTVDGMKTELEEIRKEGK
jgi:hypothetical protein